MSNRVIKFRAWSKERGLMLSQSELQCDLAPFFGDLPSDYKVLMQYTGLIDMDGTEIYEDDIVKVFNTITGGVAPPKRVTWNGETARFNGLSLGTSRVMKVVGNIYENPELLATPHVVEGGNELNEYK